MIQTDRAARFPVAEHPVRRFKHIRWQVSRLAEQDFSSDPRLPDPMGVSGIEDLSGHGRGGGCFGVQVLDPSP
jgi:hypothetical protein